MPTGSLDVIMFHNLRVDVLARGVTGYDNFLSQTFATVRSGPQSVATAAKCFENNASFLPLSEFSRDSADGSFTYRLRVACVWYEQIRITPESNGSRLEIRLSPGLDAKWQANFERDRAAVAALCLSSAVTG
jgi:hypothetical protein